MSQTQLIFSAIKPATCTVLGCQKSFLTLWIRKEKNKALQLKSMVPQVEVSKLLHAFFILIVISIKIITKL